MRKATLLLLGIAGCFVLVAQDVPIGSDVHAPLFQAPKSESIASQTARLVPQAGAAPSAEVAHKNFIDDFVFAKMATNGVPHAGLAYDREFLRRIYLDLTGRIPSSEQVREFIANDAADKRSKLIDQLIGSPEFADKWSYFFMDTLRINGKSGGYQLFHYMLKQSLAADRPYDDLARAMMSASGKSNLVVAAVNPITREHVEGMAGQVDHGDDLRKVQQSDTHDELTVQFGKVFLGMNLSCISCHDGANHLEKVNVYLTGKKRTDFFQQAAFMGNTRYIPHVERTEAIMAHFVVDDLAPGYDTKAETMLRMGRLGGPNEPKFILTDEIAATDADPRDELARMMTADLQFSRATVNMFWAKLMGFGFVEPYDEFDLARQDPNNLPEGWDVQPSHPELLNELAKHFRESNYSLHELFRVICNSSAYQLSASFPGEWNDTYTKYYARKFARMLTAEELHDAIVTATGASDELRDGSRTVAMAMQVSVPQNKGDMKSFMQAFGQNNRGTVARPPSPSPLQPIMMMRSSVVNDRVAAENDSRLEKLLKKHASNAAVVEDLFLSSIARLPTPAEKDVALTAMAQDRQKGGENLQWALLNLSEFLYNF
ncbi:MAG: DUF1549 domain-containing protein [Acidobacteria bacterium]|nr:DUF1549 domain-containing protein [Acidobacteriota bacterium]MDA1235363.1 DUF1549 domain-containing protein [Acidobacteriota bacterium]